MTFLHLGLLPLAALAVVPILLHLLTLHRLRTVELSTYRFLFDSYVQQRRQMKFLEALLALLRTLFMLALVLVVLPAGGAALERLFGGGSGREVVMLVDASASMNAKTAASSATGPREGRGAVGRRAARQRRPAHPASAVGARPREVFSRFSSDAETIREKIEAWSPARRGRTCSPRSRQVFGPGRRRTARRRPFICSPTASRRPGARSATRGSTGSSPRGRGSPSSTSAPTSRWPTAASIGEAPRQRQAVLGLPVRLRPRVANHSKTEPAEVTVGVFLDEKEVAPRPFIAQAGRGRLEGGRPHARPSGRAPRPVRDPAPTASPTTTASCSPCRSPSRSRCCSSTATRPLTRSRTRPSSSAPPSAPGPTATRDAARLRSAAAANLGPGQRVRPLARRPRDHRGQAQRRDPARCRRRDPRQLRHA